MVDVVGENPVCAEWLPAFLQGLPTIAARSPWLRPDRAWSSASDAWNL